MWRNYHNVSNLSEALELLSKEASSARVIAGGTDLILEIENEVRTGISTLVDITRVPGLDNIYLDEAGWLHLGPLVTHNDCISSDLVRQYGLPLALASYEVAAPQIRNRSTVAGNIITGSPANDTITPLMALGAQITLRSAHSERQVPFSAFYSGFRQTVMRPDEILVDIAFPALGEASVGMFVKLGLRQAQAISLVHVSSVLHFEDNADGEQMVQSAAIALGSVGPIIIRATEAEAYLNGKSLSSDVIENAAVLAQNSAAPIDDVRGSAAYRMEMVRVCTLRSLRAMLLGQTQEGLPIDPVLLQTPDRYSTATSSKSGTSQIHARVNGEAVQQAGWDMTLLDWLRDQAGLVGTKEGCAEGECGACTVFLDGQAVMSCLVPAGRADGAEIVTIEGLATESGLHPIQQAFVEHGAVQCGYCTPGFLMSGAMLMNEKDDPSEAEMKQAITGNLCRCTGYYKIIEAMKAASQMQK
jgi:carbon-monoxide dehydrogenase medium subunit